MVTKPRGKVRDLERARLERLADEIEPALERAGQLVADTATLDDSTSGVPRRDARAVVERR